MDIYGKARKQTKETPNFVPFRYQGQYYDSEVDLCYNRFRYYSPETGTYISQDPIGLLGNNPNFYAYVKDTNT
ncbi:RHS repeat-associated core domain-containing protein [Capnocytophaga canimorsus]|uniref:RHS repeat-associated core domain-containing protein n=1 Tax=Capnocytophaga canimorsus TaxID=28188 RepID=UPI0037CF3E17